MPLHARPDRARAPRALGPRVRRRSRYPTLTTRQGWCAAQAEKVRLLGNYVTLLKKVGGSAKCAALPRCWPRSALTCGVWPA